MGCCNSRQTHSDLHPHHGLVPPHLARQLTRFVYQNDPLHVPGLAPRWSLELELIWRTVPPNFWLNKAREEGTVLKQLNAVRTKLKQLEWARGSHDLENTRRELADRWFEIKMGYSVVFHARYDFLLWLTTRNICREYAYQALEEFAEGTAGGLSPYWPATARQACSEGVLVPADWIIERFNKERDERAGLSPPELAFLHVGDRALFSKNPPVKIQVIQPRNPSSRIRGIKQKSSVEEPPPYASFAVHNKLAPLPLHSPHVPSSKGNTSIDDLLAHGDRCPPSKEAPQTVQ